MAGTDALEALRHWTLYAKDKLRPLPGILYTSESFLDLEIEALFHKKWINVGHISELRKPGDFLTLQVTNKPILVACDKDGEIRAFANVCQHRCSILARGSGNCKVFTCPYHAWVYNLDGTLRGAPHMDLEQLTHVQLPEYALEIWQGLVFVNLDSAPEALAPQLTELKARIEPYDFPSYRVIQRQEMAFACNWKVLVENFCESYHVFRVHKTTIEPATPTTSIRVWDGGDTFNHHTMTSRITDTEDPAVNRLPENLQKLDHLICVYPCLAFSIDPSISIWLNVLPTGPQTLMCVAQIAVLSEAGAEQSEKAEKQIKAATAAFMAEDKSRIEGVQLGLAADVGNSGVLHEWERTNWEFGQYLVRQLLVVDN